LKSWWADRSKNIDQAKAEQKAREHQDVQDFADVCDEDSYVALVKSRNPSITPAELHQKIEQFRELCQIRASRAGRRLPF
jgi:hypothetical protein